MHSIGYIDPLKMIQNLFFFIKYFNSTGAGHYKQLPHTNAVIDLNHFKTM